MPSPERGSHADPSPVPAALGRRRLFAAAFVLFLVVCRMLAPASADPAAALHLEGCSRGAFCGYLTRPLDPNGRIAGTVPVHFRWYPVAGNAHAVGTIVTVEGGPGYSSIGSSSGYLALFGPLRATHNVLIVDNRGTGRSNAIDCEPLQKQVNRLPSALADCGRQLGASGYLYGTAEAADDLAAIVDALNIAQIDLYGDSYGTFFGQTFAVRHPDKIRTLILDSAYPVVGESAWYPYQAPTARRAFNLACARTPACAALGGTSMLRIDALIAALRVHPIVGNAPDGNGRLREVTATAPALFALMIAESNAPTIYRELDAAARAEFNGDALPLLRLLAEARLADPENGSPTGPAAFSEGLFVAVQCGDYPQLYDLRVAPQKRHEQLAAALALERLSHPDVYAPFTIDESQDSPYNDNAIALCVDWARPNALEPLAQPIAPGSVFPKLPVLVLSGEFDTVTTPAEGHEAARLFPLSTWLVVPNSIHETAISDGGNYISPGGDLSGCVSAIVLHFVTARTAGDTSCLAAIRPIRAVPAFPLRTKDVFPASPARTSGIDLAKLRVASAVVAGVGDVLNRYWANYSGTGAGLRGGSFRIKQQQDGYEFELDRIHYTTDLALNGRFHWNQIAGIVSGAVDLSGSAGNGRLAFAWNERSAGARAVVSGSIDGTPISAFCPAP